MKSFRFETSIKRPSGVGTWHYADIPLDAEKAFGKKGQIKVKAQLNGHAFYGSLMPHGDGRHFIVLNEDIRSKAGAKLGDTVTLNIEEDSEPRTVNVPEDMREALHKNDKAQTFFEGLAYSHKKSYVDWIEQSKKPETRINRIQKAVDMLSQEQKLK